MSSLPDAVSPLSSKSLISPLLPGETSVELQKMIDGAQYLATDLYLSRLRDLAVVRSDACNLELDGGKRMELYREWVNVRGRNCWIMRGFTCEYVRLGPAHLEGGMVSRG